MNVLFIFFLFIFFLWIFFQTFFLVFTIFFWNIHFGLLKYTNNLNCLFLYIYMSQMKYKMLNFLCYSGFFPHFSRLVHILFSLLSLIFLFIRLGCFTSCQSFSFSSVVFASSVRPFVIYVCVCMCNLNPTYRTHSVQCALCTFFTKSNIIYYQKLILLH